MKLLVIGAGAWGTALAVNAAAAPALGPQRTVTLWARDAALLQSLQRDRVNTRYLPGIALPASLQLAGGSGVFGVDLAPNCMLVSTTSQRVE